MHFLVAFFLVGTQPHMLTFQMADADECVFVMGRVRGAKEFPKNATFVCIELAPEGDPS